MKIHDHPNTSASRDARLSKSGKAESVRSDGSSVGRSAVGGDRVDVSASAAALSEAIAQSVAEVREAPGADPARLAELHSAVEQDRLPLDAGLIAEAVLDDAT